MFRQMTLSSWFYGLSFDFPINGTGIANHKGGCNSAVRNGEQMEKLLIKAAATGLLIFFNIVSLNAQSSIPAGTKVTLKMDNGINSESATKGDTFTAITTKVVKTESGTLPKGTKVEGVVTKSVSAGSNDSPGQLEVEFTRVFFSESESERRIDAELSKPLIGEKRKGMRTLSILGGTALGGIVGLLGGSKGALIGAGIGAGAGTGIAVSRKGKDVGIDSDEEFEIVLKKELKLPADGF